MEEKAARLVEHNFRKAWCDIMREKIALKDWDMFEVCLTEIVTRLKEMIPNLAHLHEQIEREIPVSLIAQMLRNDAVIPKDFLQYFGAIMRWLKELGPPDMDDTVDDMLTDLGKVSPDSYLSALPETILAINLHMDVVEHRIDKFKDELTSLIANGDDTN